jgi:hypothetical protein
MRTLTQRLGGISIHHPADPGRSFNGRTSGSEPLNRGSTPCLPATVFKLLTCCDLTANQACVIELGAHATILGNATRIETT